MVRAFSVLENGCISKMQLSEEATNDLRKTLEKEIGVEQAVKISDENLNYIGLLLLEVFKQGLVRIKKLNNPLHKFA